MLSARFDLADGRFIQGATSGLLGRNGVGKHQSEFGQIIHRVVPLLGEVRDSSMGDPKMRPLPPLTGPDTTGMRTSLTNQGRIPYITLSGASEAELTCRRVRPLPGLPTARFRRESPPPCNFWTSPGGRWPRGPQESHS